MRKKLVVAALILIMALFQSDAYGQDSFDKVRKRARTFEPIILAAASRHNVDPHLLWTIAYLESRFNPQAISYKKGHPCAFGLMQFTPGTARRYDLTNPLNPNEAIHSAGQYVRDLMIRFDGRVDLVLAAYNAGEATVEAFLLGKRLKVNGKIINPRALRTGGIPPYAETKRYVAQGVLLARSIVGHPHPRSSMPSRLKINVSNSHKVLRTTDSLYVSNFLSVQSENKPAKAALSVYVQ